MGDETIAPRRILLVDADAFFVAVARQEDPEGAGKAALLIVGGRPGSRGVVCSASYECRAYGVRSAMPIARALRLCPDATCVPVPRHACSKRSREIAAVLARFAPVVQPSSIDEWYCDLGGTEALYEHESLDATAHRIRDAVREATGLSVSIGGGTSKLIAKMAVELAKPKPGTGATGVRCVDPGDEATFLAPLRAGDLPGVGPKFAASLERHGLYTLGDVQRHTRDALIARIGERSGDWLWRRARGIDASIVARRETQKQTSREDTFARDLHDDDEVERELLRLAVRVTADLRADGVRARVVTVKLRDSDFRTRSAQRTLREPIESERSVIQVARPLLRMLRKRRRTGVRLLGIALSGFDEGEHEGLEQLPLFELPAAVDEPSEGTKDRALASALDRIRGRFGSASIVPATLIVPQTTGPRVEE